MSVFLLKVSYIVAIVGFVCGAMLPANKSYNADKNIKKYIKKEMDRMNLSTTINSYYYNNSCGV